MAKGITRKDNPLTLDRLRELLHYNPQTGLFTWRIRKGGTANKGTPAGTINNCGYLAINLDSLRYVAHRLAWFYMTGAWPIADIDHKDGDRRNNRFANLREATRSQNLRNSRKRTTGLKGASFNKMAQRWIATIRVDGTQRYLGLFNTEQQAHQAYCNAAMKLEPQFARFK
jgi:hypothetical protein